MQINGFNAPALNIPYAAGDYVGGPYGCSKFDANPSMGALEMGEIEQKFSCIFIYSYLFRYII